ncbi:hypothetical protein HI914_06890 [Erysiphe necator]|uniref:Uncharacterized protein n=1 Tax=Uncinula necator TaxID=52586 RepID=A0A0B1P5I6_UNCNE|nr:hypothetical protein HI914_06890 [Erysiphe necator]KHJ33947.1 hypothetical protein EV44_g0960 [Erysiphe necator]
MEFVKKFSGSSGHQTSTETNDKVSQDKPSGGFLSSLHSKMDKAAGGGRESEKNEDYLDKAVDMFQEKVLGKGKQDNESAMEQAKDEAISDSIRKGYKNATGKDFPIKDKPTRFN